MQHGLLSLTNAPSALDSPSRDFRRYTTSREATSRGITASPDQPIKSKRKRRRSSSDHVINLWDFMPLVTMSKAVLGLVTIMVREGLKEVDKQEQVRQARNKVLEGCTEDEVVVAMEEVRSRLAEEAERARTRNQMPDLSVPTFEGDSEVLKMIAKLTEKERAVLRACMTGEVETRFFYQQRRLGSGHSVEAMSLGEKWREEQGRSYWNCAP